MGSPTPLPPVYEESWSQVVNLVLAVIAPALPPYIMPNPQTDSNTTREALVAERQCKLLS
jgi:hypothetical protein